MSALQEAISLAIIAGGQSRRMGRDKAFIKLGGKPIIQHVLERSASLQPAQTMLITNSPRQYAFLGLPMHGDALPGTGALGGIYTALLQARSPWVLTLACDMPFVSPGLLQYMASLIDDEHDIVVPRVDGYPQALHALYRKTCLPPIRAQLAAQRLKIIRFYGRMRVRYLDEAEYAPFADAARAFLNLNTPAELAAAVKLLDGA